MMPLLEDMYDRASGWEHSLFSPPLSHSILLDHQVMVLYNNIHDI